MATQAARRFTDSELKSPSNVRHVAQAIGAVRGLNAYPTEHGFDGNHFSDSVVAMARRGGLENRTPDKLFSLAISSGGEFNDLAALTMQLVESAVLQGFDTAPNGWMDWTHQRTVPNYNDFQRSRVMGFDLQSVPQGANIPAVSFPAENAERHDEDTRAVIVRLSRHQFLNDDLSFLDIARAAGRAAALAVSRDVYGVLSDNPVLADTGQLFNSTAVTTAGGHANAAAVGAAVSSATLQTAKKSIRTKAGQPGSGAMLFRPRFLIVPSAIEDTAWTALGTPYGLGEPGSGHERAMLNAGRMQLVVAPELDTTSATAWYVAADPADAALVEVAHRGNSMKPQVRGVRPNFDHDAIEALVTFDYSVRPGNWRAGFRNPGA